MKRNVILMTLATMTITLTFSRVGLSAWAQDHYTCSMTQQESSGAPFARSEKSDVYVFHSPFLHPWFWGKSNMKVYLYGKNSEHPDPVEFNLEDLKDSQNYAGKEEIEVNGGLFPFTTDTYTYVIDEGLLDGNSTGKILIVDWEQSYGGTARTKFQLDCTRID